MAVLVEEHRRLLEELTIGILEDRPDPSTREMLDTLGEYEKMEQGEYEKIVEAQRHMARKMQSSGDAES